MMNSIFIALTLARYWKHAFYRKADEYKKRITSNKIKFEAEKAAVAEK